METLIAGSVGAIVGALVSGLIAWGAMRADVRNLREMSTALRAELKAEIAKLRDDIHGANERTDQLLMLLARQGIPVPERANFRG